MPRPNAQVGRRAAAVLALISALWCVALVSAVGVIENPETSSRMQGDVLAVGETVRLRLSTHGGADVRFLLCGHSRCGTIKIRGIAADGRLSFRSYVGVDLYGNGGKRIQNIDVGVGVPNPDGSHIFLVTRDSPDQMTVYLEGHEDKAVSVHVDPEFTRLIVRRRWSGTAKAEFVPPTGDRRQGERLSIGESARIRVTTEGDAFTRFLMCGDESCSMVDVLGITSDNRISYWTQTDADHEGYRGRFGAGGDLFVRFPSGAHEFVVERRSEKEVSVWLAALPDRVANVAVKPDNDRLTIKDPWRDTVNVQFLKEGSTVPSESHSREVRETARLQGDLLNIGETIRVKLHTHGSPDLRFKLCGSSNCGVVDVRGIRPNGQISYVAFSDANLLGNGGHVDADVNNGYGIADGDHLFMVRRVSGREMSIWPDRHPENAATVRVQPAYNRLTVQRRWSGITRSTFITPTNKRRQGERLAVGESARVRVTAEGDAFARFMMCGDTSCSLVDILGITPDGRISYWMQHNADKEGYHGTFGPGGDLYVPYPPGSRDFVVERRSEDEAAVWLAERPKRVAIIPVTPGNDRLTVKDPWKDSVKSQFLNVCGKATGGPAELVLNGESTPIESVPWHAALYIERQGRKDYICGGSLVAPCAVVTAAHCVPKDGTIFVALGKTLSGWDSEEGEGIHKTKVKKAYKHPFFKGFVSKLVYDIAILELETCAKLDKKVFPVCVDDTFQPESSAEIKVAGWGNESSVLVELEAVKLAQLNFEDCFKAMSRNAQQLGFITHDKFCAKRRENTPLVGLLQGDSGGGALVKRDGSWYLAGIVSVRLQGGQPQHDDIFALTDASKYADWIAERAKW